MMNTEQIPIPKAIGSYQVDQRIAIGGMGEIYLVQDPASPRKLALKKIREDRLKYPTLKERFLREAKIASQLSHPCIIPIYSTFFDQEPAYYTMPYVEGQTLKEILKQQISQSTKSPSQTPNFSLATLVRIFLSVCQGIAYCHSKGILHRDIKPENVILGKFGQTLILDWGLADYIEGIEDEKNANFELNQDLNLTRPGKIPGTLSYIAPERILHGISSQACDIYALGVVLYQILSLKLPFHRKSVKNIKKIVKEEKFISAIEKAPYRDIPKELDSITQKCLASDPKHRYANVAELICDIENYIEGKGQWSLCKQLDIADPLDWQFQENILLTKHQALTPSLEMTEWINLMLSKEPLGETLRIEVSVTLKKEGKGIGFLLKVPGPSEKTSLMEEGICLWLGSKVEPGFVLSRSKVDILSAPDLALDNLRHHTLLLEVQGGHLQLFIDGKLSFAFHSHIPSFGDHIGVMLKDSEFDIKPLKIFSFSPQIYVSCLEIPDRFAVDKQYEKALIEYRKIIAAFPGRSEQRLAIFKAGICLIEWAKTKKTKKEKTSLIEAALEQFSTLKKTSSAPVEYLGKSIAYQTLSEIEEEVKCLEFPLYKYPNHPQKHLIEEQLLFRLHQSAYQNRIHAHYFFLLALRHLPHIFSLPQHHSLLQAMQKQSHPIWFLPSDSGLDLQNNLLWLRVATAFTSQKSSSLLEIISNCSDAKIIDTVLFALIEMGRIDLAKEHLQTLISSDEELSTLVLLIHWKEKKITSREVLKCLYPFNNKPKQRVACHLLLNTPPKIANLFLQGLLEVYSLLQPQVKAYIVAESFLQDIHEGTTLDKIQDMSIDPRWRAIFSLSLLQEPGNMETVFETFEKAPTFYLLDKFFLSKGQLFLEKKQLPLFPSEKKELAYLLNLVAVLRKKQHH